MYGVQVWLSGCKDWSTTAPANMAVTGLAYLPCGRVTPTVGASISPPPPPPYTGTHPAHGRPTLRTCTNEVGRGRAHDNVKGRTVGDGR